MATASPPQRARLNAPVRLLVLVDGGALGSTAAAAHVLSRWQEEAGAPLSSFVAATAGLGWGAAVAVMAAMSGDAPLGARLGFLTEPTGVFGTPIEADPSRAARYKRTLLRTALGDATLGDLHTHVITGLLDVRRRRVVPLAHAPGRTSSEPLRRVVDALTATPLVFSPVRLALDQEAVGDDEHPKNERWFADASRVWSREAFALHAMLAVRRQLAPGESLVVVRIRAGVPSPDKPSASALKYGGASVWASVEAAARAPCVTADLREIAAAIDVELIDIEPVVPAKSAAASQPHRAWREAAAAAFAAHRTRLMAITERARASSVTASPPASKVHSLKISPPPTPAKEARPVVRKITEDDDASSEDDDGDDRNESASDTGDDSDTDEDSQDDTDSGTDDDESASAHDKRVTGSKRAPAARGEEPPGNCNVQ